ncbi:pyrrolo-quinoline quinone [Asticcacaulis biprosthecium C19]|uniref:Pyrrolo-quinoline quinone n=1 Tax=Asticcacaulis biprosthecium C19 TaxID=715226 RepID=F4QIU9_9CAUL|nr:DCC1-like thiol-disulfide oxidoreductase family protein [Asticcacaulis biprosthecium]EGF93012.1 pyrrolo-quinoline quinone [Asticcacaulis biprosthecium C19]
MHILTAFCRIAAGDSSAKLNPMSEGAPIQLVYDGDCPFCMASARMVRIKQAVGSLQILNAREIAGTPLGDEIAAHGLDLNQGIVVKFEDRLYHGEDALHLLAMIGSDRGWLNRLNVALFRNKATVALFYPAMKAIRRLMLRLNGKQPI